MKYIVTFNNYVSGIYNNEEEALIDLDNIKLQRKKEKKELLVKMLEIYIL
jgi:hypothetical protein